MTKSVKEEIEDIYRGLAAKNARYRERQSQRIMVAEVAKTLWNGGNASHVEVQNIIAIEAPTGSGKGLGYLIPGIVVARRLKKQVVVSTATVKLQQQLSLSDLPLLNEAIEGGITFAVAKGRRRYVCPSRLEREAGAAGQMDMMGEDIKSKTAAADRMIIQLHSDFNSGQWVGDRDSISIDDGAWREISTDRSGCTGSKCSHYKNCPFFKARREMESKDVIVANHDLVLSDLSLGGGVVLTKPEDTFYLIDEAHHLADKALGAFAGSFQLGGGLRVIERLGGEFARSIPDKAVGKVVTGQAEALADALIDFEQTLKTIESLQKEGDVLRFPFGEIPEELATMSANIRIAGKTVSDTLDKVMEWAKENAEKEMSQANAEKFLTELSLQVETVQEMVAVSTSLEKDAPVNGAPIAKWVEIVSYGRTVDYRLSTCPVSAAEMLKGMFYDNAAAVVLTSATLSALGNFRAFQVESGLSLMGNRAKCIALPSPFNFAKQAKLVLPVMQSNPKGGGDSHTIEIAGMIPALYPETGGMLVLFSSYKQMNYVVSQLPASLREITLVQGDQPMDVIVEAHKQRVQENGRSVLFGLQSLAEGVDLPRAFCVRVVITKLPFEVPSDPISATRSEWLESLGKNPFSEDTLPAVSRKLNQWAGRLIRSEDDWGDIFILDPRMVKSGYGKRLMDALPAFERHIHTQANQLKAAA